MIGKHFDKLDDDFITLCARLMLNRSYLRDGVDYDMERLASKHQPNAIELWYEFHEIGENDKIDGYIGMLDKRDHKFLSCDELAALAAYHKRNNAEMEQFDDLSEATDKKLAELKKINEAKSTSMLAKMLGRVTYNLEASPEKCIDDIDELRTEMKKIPMIRCYRDAYFTALKESLDNEQNLIVKERMLELKSEIIFNIDPDNDNAEDNLYRKDFKDMANQLYKEYRRIDDPVSETPDICYALARSLEYTEPMTKVDKFFSTELMSALASRELHIDINPKAFTTPEIEKM